MSSFLDGLRAELGPELAITEEQGRLLEAHFLLLTKWNRKMNLTSLEETEEIIIRHYCESIFLSTLLPTKVPRILDAGSGAGFPGIPLAILRPQTTVTLVDSDRRKCIFLQEATYHYKNVVVLAQRLNTVSCEVDWLVSRAVANRDVLATAERVASHIALMLGEEGVSEAAKSKEWRWEAPLPMLWGARRRVLIGHNVSRGTSTI